MARKSPAWMRMSSSKRHSSNRSWLQKRVCCQHPLASNSDYIATGCRPVSSYGGSPIYTPRDLTREERRRLLDFYAAHTAATDAPPGPIPGPTWPRPYCRRFSRTNFRTGRRARRQHLATATKCSLNPGLLSQQVWRDHFIDMCGCLYSRRDGYARRWSWSSNVWRRLSWRRRSSI